MAMPNPGLHLTCAAVVLRRYSRRGKGGQGRGAAAAGSGRHRAHMKSVRMLALAPQLEEEYVSLVAGASSRRTVSASLEPCTPLAYQMPLVQLSSSSSLSSSESSCIFLTSTF